MEELATLQPDGPVPPVQPIPPVHACPHCSAPPALVSRPWIARGARSGFYMILGCSHVHDLLPDRAYVADNPQTLATAWNTYAAAAAATRFPEGSPRRETILQALQP